MSTVGRMIADRGMRGATAGNRVVPTAPAGPAPFRLSDGRRDRVVSAATSAADTRGDTVHPLRRTIGLGLAAGLLLVAAGPASAAAPQVYTWSNDVDSPYFDCGASRPTAYGASATC